MQIVKLNLIPGGVLPVCFASQHDTGRVIRFMLFEGENVFTLSGAESIELRLKKPDGSELVESVTNTSADYVDVVTTADTCDTAGASVGEIVITDGGDVIGSANFGLFVESDAFDGGGIVTQTASGPIATFETNIETAFVSLKSDINPVQDLHGYSKPWSGGGGKNKLENTSTVATLYGVTFSKNDDGSVKLTGTSTGSGTGTYINFFTLPSGTYIFTDGSTSTNYYMFLMVEGDGTWYKNGMSFTVDGNTRTRVVMYIASGTATNTTLYPMIRLASVVDATFEPYSNICPISGFSGANVTRTGKNFAKSDNTDNPQKSYYSYTTETPDKVVGVKNHASNMFFYVFEAYVVSGNTYHFHYGKYQINGANSNCSIYLYSDNVLGTSLGNFLVPDTGYTWTSNYTGRILIGIYGIGGNGSTFEIDEFMLSDTATDYLPYNGQTATVNFGQTVYGGVADVTNGKVNVAYAKKKINELTWNYVNIAGSERFYSTSLSTVIEKPATIDIVSTLKCSCYETVSERQYAQFASNNIIAVQTTGFVVIRDTNYTSVSDLLNAVGEQEICYPLANPTEITTTPENLTAISGENNVYGDTNGDTEVEYYIEV